MLKPWSIRSLFYIKDKLRKADNYNIINYDKKKKVIM